jgi:hypothetical protein
MESKHHGDLSHTLSDMVQELQSIFPSFDPVDQKITLVLLQAALYPSQKSIQPSTKS